MLVVNKNLWYSMIEFSMFSYIIFGIFIVIYFVFCVINIFLLK